MGAAGSDLRIDGKVVLLTGGAHGQGSATAQMLAEAGGVVTITDLDEDVGRVTANQIGAAGFVRHDVADEASWASVVHEMVDAYGRIDVLCNNAGVIVWKTMTETDADTWDRVLAVNQTGVFLGMRAVAPVMKAQRAGSIINTSSVGGLGGSSPCFAYGASKWAVRGMTRGAAQELGPFGIRVNALLPGTIESRMIDGFDPDAMAAAIPLRRIGARADVARLTLWLASDESSYATGADFLLDGGSRA